MISDKELDQLIKSQHGFFPNRTLEEIARVYAQSAEAARSTGKDAVAAWYDSMASALYKRLNRVAKLQTWTTLQFSTGDRVEVIDRKGEVLGRGMITRIIASRMGFSIEFEDTVPNTNSRTGVVLAKNCRKVGEC
jgi:hypothetical protein